MIKRIDFLISEEGNSQYGALYHFNEKLQEALELQGIDCKLILFKTQTPEEGLEVVINRRPDLTISFHAIPFFSDLLGIPHLVILMDAPFYFFDLMGCTFGIFTNMDRASVEFYRRMGFKNMLFFPHAVESDITYDPSASRPYDVVMLSSCIDYLGIRDQWKFKFPEGLVKVMDAAIAICLAETKVPSYEAFTLASSEWAKSFGSLVLSLIPISRILGEIELYLRGKDRVELIRSVQSGQVHVFGAGPPEGNWEKYVGWCPNVIIHEPVPFEQTFDIMRQSKIVLNSCPTIKDGLHERLVGALACGAVVISSESDYIVEQFGETGAVATYSNPLEKGVNEAVKNYLKNPKDRAAAAEKGRQVVMERHTWDCRVRQLLEELPPILEKLNEGKITE